MESAEIRSDDKAPQEGKLCSATLVNWNIETFFDAEKSGCEYAEFQSSSNWTREKYQARLERLCSVIKELDADIYAFEEIENEAVMQDISNQLSGGAWNSKKNWGFSCFAKPEESAIGCGILSRFPISGVQTHFLDIRVHDTEQPISRYMLEADIEINGVLLKLFVNHWKSKSGGAEKSDIWRNWQESMLAGRLIEVAAQKENQAVLICGDFNRDIREFCCRGNTVYLRNAGFGGTKAVEVRTPWLFENGDFSTPIGSYYYQDNWERIDQIFAYGTLRLHNFSPKSNGEWADSTGVPKRYTMYNGSGYSDHLPLFCSLSF